MLPTVGADTIKTVRYAAEVSGRILGIAAMTNLVPDATRRTALVNAGNAIQSSTQALHTAYVARSRFEDLDQRLTFGRGKGVDRGFDGLVAVVSEMIRTSLPDRIAQNPEYRAIFPNGTEEFTSPTIREDKDIAAQLQSSIQASQVPVKTEVLALLEGVAAVVEPVATAVSEGEKQVNALFQAELNARKTVVDALWEQRKIVETTLGRAGKGLARFIFFDFRKPGDAESAEPATPTPQEPPPATGG